MKSDRVYQHPSYGLISIDRQGCSKSNCFMAEEIELGGHIQIRVDTAYLTRRLSRNYVHRNKSVLSLRLSYHQFAELITNLNNGSGTPCTLEWITPEGRGEVKSYCPPPAPRTEFESELKNTLAEGLQVLEELKNSINELSTKGKAGKEDLSKLRKMLETVTRQLTDSVPWVEKSFQEAMDATVSRSKIEALAWMEDQMRALGLQAIAQSNQALELERSKDTKPAGEPEE